ncbi:MAG: TlpA family protein disulfide reductase [Terriglobales bacterium]
MLVIFYAVKVRHLEARLANAEGIQSGLVAGERVGAVRGEDLAGRPTSLLFGADLRPTVLYVFTPTCIWCRRNMANLKALIAADQSRFRFVGISLAQDNLLPGYLAANSLKFTALIRDLPAAELGQLRLGVTPQTIVVSPAGVVLQDWRGAYTGPVEQGAGRYFGIRFPGLLNSNAN